MLRIRILDIHDTATGVRDRLEAQLAEAAGVVAECAIPRLVHAHPLLLQIRVQQHVLDKVLFQGGLASGGVRVYLQMFVLINQVFDVLDLEVGMTTVLLQAISFLVENDQIYLEIT